MKEFIEKLIEMLEEEIENVIVRDTYTKGKNAGLRKAKITVNQLAEEYNNGWILCSSGKFPKDKERVFITHQIKGCPPERLEANYSKDIGWYDEETAELFETCEVIAWQSLPPVYQLEGEWR